MKGLVMQLLMPGSMQDYHQLYIWKRAMDYTVTIYKFCATLPEDEKYNLVSQLRRAASSVPLNIAEGCGTASRAEFARFLGYAYRSLKEVVTNLELCNRLYPRLPQGRADLLVDEGNQLSRMIYKLMCRLTSANKNRRDSKLTTQDS